MALIEDIDMSMADAILPAIPAASDVYVHTGNIINRQFISKKASNTTDEIKRALSCSMNSWMSAINKQDTKMSSVVDVDRSRLDDQAKPDSTMRDRRHDLKLTVKLFVVNAGPSCVKEALSAVCAKLGTGHIETVILSIPGMRPGVPYEQYQPFWEAAQQLTAFKAQPDCNEGCERNGSELGSPGSEDEDTSGDDVFISWTLGLADLDSESLQDICSKAAVKPAIDQLNVDVCCSPPDELVTFCKDNEIQLLTHNDPREVLPQADLDEVMQNVFSHEKDVSGWRVGWVLRYSTLVKCRGIIHSKGYIVHLMRPPFHNTSLFNGHGDPAEPSI
jgi:glutamate--cysteine ligase regulatory subunit